MAYFDPRPSEVCNRTLSQRRDQLKGEPVGAYAAALRKIAVDCNFGTPYPTTRLYDKSTMMPLDMMTPDRFACGLRNVHIPWHLFAEQDFSFKTAYDIALQAECAVNQHRDLRSQAGDIQQAASVPGRGNATGCRLRTLAERCWRCDDDSHHASACCFHSVTCNLCRQPGHIKISCQQKNQE